jgi:hypothetical protein
VVEVGFKVAQVKVLTCLSKVNILHVPHWDTVSMRDVQDLKVSIVGDVELGDGEIVLISHTGKVSVRHISSIYDQNALEFLA